METKVAIVMAISLVAHFAVASVEHLFNKPAGTWQGARKYILVIGYIAAISFIIMKKCCN